MFILRISQQILSTVVVSLNLSSICFPKLVSAQTTQKDIAAQIQIRQSKFRAELYTLETKLMGIPFDDFSVQTLYKLVDSSQCLSGAEADYFLTQNSISRSKFSLLFSKCLRYLLDKHPNGTFIKNNLSLLESEDNFKFSTFINEFRGNLKRIGIEYEEELILSDEELFSDTFYQKRNIATINKKLTQFKNNLKYEDGIFSNLNKEEYKSLLYLTGKFQCIPKDIDFERYTPEHIDNWNLSRLEIGYVISLCFDHINEIISENPNNIPFSRDELRILQTIQDQFAAELASLKGMCSISLFRGYFFGTGCV
jgi:hypothetical protein